MCSFISVIINKWLVLDKTTIAGFLRQIERERCLNLNLKTRFLTCTFRYTDLSLRTICTAIKITYIFVRLTDKFHTVSPFYYLGTFFTRPVAVRNRQKGGPGKKVQRRYRFRRAKKCTTRLFNAWAVFPLVNGSQFFQNSMGTATLFVWEFGSAWNKFFFEIRIRVRNFYQTGYPREVIITEWKIFYRLQFLFFSYRFQVSGFPRDTKIHFFSALQHVIKIRTAIVL